MSGTSKRQPRKARKLALFATLASATACLIGLALFDQPAAGAQEQITVKIATVAPEGTPWEKQLRRFKKHLQTESGGRFRVKLFLGGALGDENALARRAANGGIQVYAGSSGALSGSVPAMGVIESPYLFRSTRHAHKKIDSAAAKEVVGRALNAGGYQFGFWAENGFRSFFTKDRAVRTPADLDGLRMRSQSSPAHLAMYRALGANPQAIGVTDVLTALQTGTVDGFDNTPLFAFASSWYQSTNHFTLSRHIYQPGVGIYSKTWYDGLPDDLKAVLTNIPDDFVSGARREVNRMDRSLIRNLERAGLTKIELTDEERDAFKEACRGVPRQIARKAGADGRALLRALR